MDTRQFVDRIAAIDLQILQLKALMRPIRDRHVEDDHTQRDRLQEEVRQLVDRKAELRAEPAKA